jgi:acyl-CoA synthetase (AMP-forming)/AMP-acid ligase II
VRLPDQAADCATLLELLALRARQQPGRPAYTFLEDGEESARYTYSELDRRARAIAADLHRISKPGNRIVLIYPPGLDFIAAFFGCLYAGAVAIPVYPPLPATFATALPRLSGLLADAGPTAVLTTRLVMAVLEPVMDLIPDLTALRWLAAEDIDMDGVADWSEPSIDSETLAFLQYTSGSTAAPRGVMVSHGNLLHNERVARTAMRHDEESTFAGWLPLYHDMGLIGNVLQPLYLGTHSVLISPLAFLQSPYRWLEAITRYRAHTSGGPNFAYDLCVRKVTPEQKAELDLSSWRVAFNGAEPVRADTLRRFSEAFAGCGFRPEAFYPCYGLAEGTLIVTGAEARDLPVTAEVDSEALERKEVVVRDVADERTRTLVSSGRTWLDIDVRIVDPTTCREAGPASIGEIWVSGPSVARGYWNEPEATAATFGGRLPDGGNYLRTGDLGFLRDGELFVTGRLKDTIIIAGRNLYPHDLELTVERSHPAIRPGNCVAFSIDVGGEERLVIVAAVDTRGDDLDPAQITKAVRKAVAEGHAVRTHDVAVVPRGIPKTTSGKLQRRACRADYLAGRYEALRLQHA